jgi:hypothetical protein
MSNYALVDGSGNIVNRIVADETFQPPAGTQLVLEPAGISYAIGGTLLNGTYTPPPAPPPSPLPQCVLPQDLIAQFTTADAAAIQSAISGNTQFWLLWSAMQAQKDPMIVTNARFLAGWTALITVLGAPRMTAIAAALGVTIT